jgi:gliding motility-associated-like protein
VNGLLTQSNFGTSGTYQITLIATNNFAPCSDTLTLSLLVYDSLMLTIPNVFSPNNDGVNDVYSISPNQNVTINYVILNRWGNVLVSNTKLTVAGISTPIWDGIDAKDGVYFLLLDVTDQFEHTQHFETFITLVR